ncbi:MAG: DNA methylase, partial [Verrucomicrobiota bacterium]|nr:DNA methylase [Verrucomicrobiota bacterium]
RWMFPAFAQLYRLLKPHRFCVSFYGWHAADRFLQAWRQCGFWPASHFTCVKPYASNVKFARMMHENAYLLAKGEPAQPPLPPADVLYWKYSGNKLHPTQKPVSLLTPLVEAYSRPGDIVLDPFAGSGTTGVAARQCRRRFILIEKDAQYHQAAAQRLSA